ncbi:MAG: hypothetical protein BGO76_03090 [Caedibacter sp. 38-128]|nr:Fis family transcriptional regulator [Holosporales bacterium]OJX08258.1 MAG: hypothetical protein BGO76_03090 [Caedibacter sp. 38-128]
MKTPLPKVCLQQEMNNVGLSVIVETKLREYFSALGDVKPTCSLYEHVIREVERPLICLVLEHAKGNKGKAADLLGINRNTLRKKLQEHNLI